MASRDRLRPLIRLMLNQIVRTLTTTLVYKDGRAVPAIRRKLLLTLDEFPILERLDVLAEALSLVAGYGIRACLVAQDLTQIYDAYGRDESITSNCDTSVAFTPNKMQTAQELSKLAGETSVRHSHRTVSSSGASTSEPEVARPLMTPAEVRRMRADEVLIFTRGQPAIRAQQLQYHAQPFFKNRAAVEPPQMSDLIFTAHPPESGREKAQGAGIQTQTDLRAAESEVATGAEGADASRASGARPALRFLKFATEEQEE
jgi:type IV secretion system protein VirD4